MSENANQLVGKLASNKRAAAIQEFKSRTFDLCIIGGGIHGAWMARDAALRGLDVALLEARDYGSATSSRSSKMLHGGVRYLERGDVSLVFDALRERARCLKLAKHLCRSSEFLFPSVKGQTKPTWMIDVGLGIYDAMGRVGQDREVRKLFPPHSRLRDSSHEFQALEGMGLDFRGLLKYSDGQMNDVRLVVEVIKEARSLGAACLNYCKVTSGKRSNDLWEIQFDSLGEPHELKAKTVVSAAGPWARLLSGDLNTNSPSSTKEKHWPDIIWSRGIHLLFKQAWNLPGLIVPTGEPGRYYFIWPWTLAGVDYTLVGTTDQRTENLEDKPVPTENEVAQLLGYLKRDLPNSGLAGAVPEQSFCGVRTLASASEMPEELRRKRSIGL